MVDIEKIEKRTVRSFYEDGLTEIALGVILLLLGGYFFAQAAVPEHSALGNVLSVLFVLVIASAGFLVNRVLRFLKRRITYPRTGYVAFKRKDRGPARRVAAGATGMVIAASFVALYSLAPSFKVLLPGLNGLLLAVVFLLFAVRIGLARIYVLAGASAAIGVGISAAGIGDVKGISLYYGLFGAALLLTGLAALVVYLRRNPKPESGGPEAPDAH